MPNVGIGTTTPGEKLSVNGAISIGAAAGTSDGTIRWTGTDFEGRKGGAWVSMTSSGSGGSYVAKAGDTMTGPLTISHATANDGLYINGTSTGTGFRIATNNAAFAYNPVTQFSDVTLISTPTDSAGIVIGPQSNSASGMRITSAGLVGVGLSYPGSKLEIKGTTADSSASAFNATNSAGTSLIFARNDGNIGIGIGNTTPSSILDVNGAYTQRGMAAPAVSNSGEGRIYFDSTANKFKVSQHGGGYVDLGRVLISGPEV